VIRLRGRSPGSTTAHRNTSARSPPPCTAAQAACRSLCRSSAESRAGSPAGPSIEVQQLEPGPELQPRAVVLEDQPRGGLPGGAGVGWGLAHPSSRVTSNTGRHAWRAVTPVLERAQECVAGLDRARLEPADADPDPLIGAAAAEEVLRPKYLVQFFTCGCGRCAGIIWRIMPVFPRPVVEPDPTLVP
jgi:hypothetical protein